MTSGGLRVHRLGGLTVCAADNRTRFPISHALWPDATPENGRRGRAGCTYRIASDSGSARYARGYRVGGHQESVSLRAGAISTDIAGFDAVVRAGDNDRVRSLYSAGPMLPAFHEDWVVLETLTSLRETGRTG